MFYDWSTKTPPRLGKKKTKNTVRDSFFHSPATWHVKGFPQKTGNSEFRGCFVFRMIRKIYKLVALSCNRGDTAEPSPRPMSNPRVVFLCYGLWQETRPHTKKTKIKKGLKKDHMCFYKTNVHLQVLKDDHLLKILCKDHLWKKTFHLAPPAFFTPFFQKKKSKHERSNQGTKVPRLSTLDIQKRSLHLKVSVGLAHFVRTFPHWGPERSQVSGDVDEKMDSGQVGYQRMLVFLGVFLGELTGVHSRLKIDRVHLSHHLERKMFRLRIPSSYLYQKGQKLEKHILTSSINRPSSINLLNQWLPSMASNHHPPSPTIHLFIFKAQIHSIHSATFSLDLPLRGSDPWARLQRDVEDPTSQQTASTTALREAPSQRSRLQNVLFFLLVVGEVW